MVAGCAAPRRDLAGRTRACRHEPRARATARASRNAGLPRATARGPEQRRPADAGRSPSHRSRNTGRDPGREQRVADPNNAAARVERREQQLADTSNAAARVERSPEHRSRNTAAGASNNSRIRATPRPAAPRTVRAGPAGASNNPRIEQRRGPPMLRAPRTARAAARGPEQRRGPPMPRARTHRSRKTAAGASNSRRATLGRREQQLADPSNAAAR